MPASADIINKYRSKLAWRKNFRNQTAECLTREEIGQMLSELFTDQIKVEMIPNNFEIFVFQPYPEKKPDEQTTMQDEFLVKAETMLEKIVTYTTASWTGTEFIGVENSLIISFAKLPAGKQ
jgi:hypothetical protein